MLASLKRALSSSSSLPATSSFVLSSYFFPVFRSIRWKKNRSTHLSLPFVSASISLLLFRFLSSKRRIRIGRGREREREREMKSISISQIFLNLRFIRASEIAVLTISSRIMDNNPLHREMTHGYFRRFCNPRLVTIEYRVSTDFCPPPPLKTFDFSLRVAWRASSSVDE